MTENGIVVKLKNGGERVRNLGRRRSGLVRLAAPGRGGVEILNAGDMQDGATNPSLGEGLFVQIHSDHDRAFSLCAGHHRLQQPPFLQRRD